MQRIIFFYVILIGFTTCTSTRFVKPLNKGQKAVFGNFGGPLIEFSGLPMPIPFATVGFGYGLHNRISIYNSVDVTSALFGVWHHEIGMSAHVYKFKNELAISVQPGLHLFQNLQTFNAFRMYPVMDFTIYKEYIQKHFILYCNGRFWMNAYRELQNQNTLTSGIHFGIQKNTTSWAHQFELGITAPGIPNTPNVVDFIGIQKKGALVIHYALIRFF
ncbi:MAG: hypothetical protein EBQ77_09195 [Sphingobacteriia bacterium]|jgi:hypothetical protein|nr:hypothetical protein [Sphingobacteriia bacterium]